MASYVGSSVIPHDIRIGRHPIQRDRQAILITQPYVEVDFLELSDDDEDTTALRTRLKTAQATYPHVIGELNDIVAGSHSLLLEQHLATDIVGRNIGVRQETASVVIVDSQPVPPDRTDDQKLVSWHAGRLESVLGTLAV